MSHASRTAMSHARYSITAHNPRRHPPKLEDTSLERPVRRLLERLSRELWCNFSSQDLRYDFWIQGVPLDVQGPQHEDNQKQIDHDAFKASKVIELGIPPPIFITAKAIKKTPELVYQMLRAIALLYGAREKEACAK